MRWLLVSSQHHSSQGGVGTYVSRFCDAAKRNGWQIELLTRPGELHPRDIPVHSVSTSDLTQEFHNIVPVLRKLELIRPYRYALWSRAVALYLLNVQSQYDAIEFVDCQAEGFASLCSGDVRRHLRPAMLLVHAHTPMYIEEELNNADIMRFGRQTYHAWERRALVAADGIIATSKKLSRHINTKRPCMVAPYIIQRPGLSDSVKTNKTSNRILLIGSVQPRKGVLTWIKSLNKVFESHPDAVASIVGPDTFTAPGGGSMIQYVLSFLSPRFRDRFEWCGEVSHQCVLEYIDRSTLVVVPSMFESFSFAAAEALDRIKPIIVSDQVGITEHVRGITVVPAQDIQMLATAQLKVLNYPTHAIKMARLLRERMYSACSAESNLNQRAEFVQQLVRQQLTCAFNDSRGLLELDEFIASVDAKVGEAMSASSCVS